MKDLLIDHQCRYRLDSCGFRFHKPLRRLAEMHHLDIESRRVERACDSLFRANADGTPRVIESCLRFHRFFPFRIESARPR